MTKQLRTRHSSYVNLDPTEYQYVGSFDSQPEPGSFVSPTFHDYTVYDGDEQVTVNALNPLHAEYTYYNGLLRESATSAYDESGKCDHCGARLRYVVVMRHTPTGDAIAIGETCHAERFDYDSKAAKDMDRLRRLAKAGRERKRVARLHEQWLAAGPGNREAEAYLAGLAADERLGEFTGSLLRQLNQKGSLSDRQVAAALRDKVRAEDLAVKKAAEAELPTAPVVEGNGVVITGEVLSTKYDEEWDTLKMLVRDDRGFKVWGTVPSALHAERGLRVQFTANVERSRKDEAFGFFKRPRKVTVLGE